MKKKTNASIILASLMAFAIIACNQQTKTDEAAQTPARDAAMDPAKVAPGVYKVVADTLNLRLLEIVVNPGDSIALHSHPDYSLYIIEGGTAEFIAKDGSKHTQELSAGMGMITPAETHAAKNTGATTVRIITTDVYRPRN